MPPHPIHEIHQWLYRDIAVLPEWDETLQKRWSPILKQLYEEWRSALDAIRAEASTSDRDLKALQDLGSTPFKDLTYDQWKTLYKKLIRARKALAYKKLTFDDTTKLLKKRTSTINKRYRPYTTHTRKFARKVKAIYRLHKPPKPKPPPKPPPKPVPLAISRPWLLKKLKGIWITNYTHFKANQTVRPILYRRGFLLRSHYIGPPIHWEFVGEDYPGPFHKRDTITTYKHFWKYGRRAKQPYIATGIPYPYQTYRFELCAFTKTEALACSFTFKFGSELPDTYTPFEPMKYPAYTGFAYTPWLATDKDSWLARAKAGTL